jgi:hypothetical protein
VCTVNFWFASLADDDSDFAGYWQVFLYDDGGCYPLPIGFMSKEDAEGFIRKSVMTAEADYS